MSAEALLVADTASRRRLLSFGWLADGWTPLHEAAARGLMDTTRLLVEHGARLDIKNKGA